MTPLKGAAREARRAVDILCVGYEKTGAALLGGGCPYKKKGVLRKSFIVGVGGVHSLSFDLDPQVWRREPN